MDIRTLRCNIGYPSGVSFWSLDRGIPAPLQNLGFSPQSFFTRNIFSQSNFLQQVKSIVQNIQGTESNALQLR